MSKILRVMLAIIFLGTLIVTSLPQQSVRAQLVDDETLIRQALNTYFDLKYEARAAAMPKAFGQLVASSARARRFLREEEDRREIEYLGASLFHLKYDSYTYTLDIKSIDFSEDKNSATVLLLEGNEVTFENLAPTVSKMGGLKHTLYLIKEHGSWVLVDDNYEDHIVRFLNINHLSKDEAKKIIIQNYEQDQKEKAEGADSQVEQPITPMSGHYYNGSAAAAWAASHYASGGPVNYNGYLGYGSDCANFVNYAMNLGAGVPMAGAPNMIEGWWSTTTLGNASDSWRNANTIVQFILSATRKSQWPSGGPDGVQVSYPYTLGLGDIMGWSWDAILDYDHVAIVTQIGGPPLITDRQRDDPVYHYNIPYTFYSGYYARIFVNVNDY